MIHENGITKGNVSMLKLDGFDIVGEKGKGIVVRWKSCEQTRILEQKEIELLLEDITALIIGIGFNYSHFFSFGESNFFERLICLPDNKSSKWNEPLSNLSREDLIMLTKFMIKKEAVIKSLPDISVPIFMDHFKKCIPFYPDQQKLGTAILGFSDMPFIINEFNDVVVDKGHPVYVFWKKWGPLFPSLNNELEYNKIILWGLTGFIWITFYCLVNEGSPPPIGLFQRNYLEKIKEKDSMYWQLDFGKNGDIVWLPINEDKHDPMNPRFLLPHPPVEFKDRKEIISWAKLAVNKNIYVYINQQRNAYNVGNQIAAHITNLFFYWLVTIIEKDVRYCPCGCGNMLKPRQEYASRKCKDKIRDKNPIRQAKSRVRTWANRGLISKNEKLKLYECIEDWDCEHKSKEAITLSLDKIQESLKKPGPRSLNDFF